MIEALSKFSFRLLKLVKIFLLYFKRKENKSMVMLERKWKIEEDADCWCLKTKLKRNKKE